MIPAEDLKQIVIIASSHVDPEATAASMKFAYEMGQSRGRHDGISAMGVEIAELRKDGALS